MTALAYLPFIVAGMAAPYAIGHAIARALPIIRAIVAQSEY